MARAMELHNGFLAARCENGGPARRRRALGRQEVEHPPVGGVEDGCDVEQHPLWGAVAAVVEDGDLVSALAPHGFVHPRDGGTVNGGDLEDTRVAAEHLAALAG